MLMLEARSVRVRGAVLTGRPVLQRRDGSRRYATAHNVCTCNIHPYTQNIHTSDTISNPEKTAFSSLFLRFSVFDTPTTKVSYIRSPRLTWATLDPSLPLLLRSSLPMISPSYPSVHPHPSPNPRPSPAQPIPRSQSPRLPIGGAQQRSTPPRDNTHTYTHTPNPHTALSPPCSQASHRST